MTRPPHSTRARRPRPAWPVAASVAARVAPFLVVLAAAFAASARAACEDFPVHGVTLHKSNYALAAAHDFVEPPSEDTPRLGYERDPTESKFQISLKTRLFETFPMYLGYTQKSFWQVYNKAQSAPFRETNYNPEAFIDCQGPFNLLGLVDVQERLGIRLGVEHESNGQTIERSRSWNRVYIWPRYVEEGEWSVEFKYWERFPETDKDDPASAEGDDNPRIDSYLGRFELYLHHVYWDPHSLHLMFRKGTRDDSGTYDASYLYRLGDKTGPGHLHVILQYFSGYGESLIDYDHRVEKWGLGVAFR